MLSITCSMMMRIVGGDKKYFDDDDDDDDDDEIDRRGDGCPVLSDTVEERGEPVLLHLDIIISLVRILLNLLYILGEA